MRPLRRALWARTEAAPAATIACRARKSCGPYSPATFRRIVAATCEPGSRGTAAITPMDTSVTNTSPYGQAMDCAANGGALTCSPERSAYSQSGVAAAALQNAPRTGKTRQIRGEVRLTRKYKEKRTCPVFWTLRFLNPFSGQKKRGPRRRQVGRYPFRVFSVFRGQLLFTLTPTLQNQ